MGVMEDRYDYNSDNDVYDRKEEQPKKCEEKHKARNTKIDIVFVALMLLLALAAFFFNYRKDLFSDFIMEVDISSSADVVTELIVNINTADKEELMKLNGIGEILAERIIEYRETNGKFVLPQDIVNVEGISENLFNNLYANLTV